MCPRMLKSVSLLMLVVFAVTLATLPSRVLAQASDDDTEQDLGPDPGDDDFQDSDSLVPLNGDEDDFTDGNQYVDESVNGPGSVDLGARQARARSQQEREQVGPNLAWGAATGLLLGGWFALLNSGDNRTTLSSVGTGVVLGAVLGLLVGARTTINPDAPQPVSTGANTPSGPTMQPLVSIEPTGFRLGLQYSF